MRIAFCTDGVFPKAIGGMQRHSRLLIEELSKFSELNITVFHPHDVKLFENCQNIVEVVVPGINESGNYLKECFAYSKRMYEALQKDNFDVIYSQGLSVWFKAEDFSDKLIVNPHGLEPYQALGFKAKLVAIPFKRVFNKIFSKSRYVVSLGGMLTDILKRHVSENKIVVLANAVNLPHIQKTTFPDSNKPIKVLFLARFARNKGIHILMEAASQLNSEGYQDQVEFYLGGKGPMYDHYNTNNNNPNVKLLGFVDDDKMQESYLESDIFVLPTLFEGMPTVVLEAMSYGLPIIVSNVGATAELVDDSNGYLIDKDDVAQLKSAIISYFKLDSKGKHELGANSFQRVKNRFTWEQVARAHVDLFQRVIQDAK